MNWQDTILTDRQINTLYFEAGRANGAESINERHVKLIAKAQAETSFKAGQQAGRQEVVDYFNGNLVTRTQWKAKLKEWGIEEETHG